MSSEPLVTGFNSSASQRSQFAGPTVFSDYWALTKPEVNFLILVTTAAGFCLGSANEGRAPSFTALFNTLFGTLLVASGTATLNQHIERHFDARMRRTAQRPVAAGRLTPREVLVFGIALSATGCIYLALSVNIIASLLALLTLLSYLFLYTPLKRRTPLCVLVGAFAGAMPPLIGWAGVPGRFGVEAWALYAILFLWQFPHFMAIAWMYREDCDRAGYIMLPQGNLRFQFVVLQTLLPLLALMLISLVSVFMQHAGALHWVGLLPSLGLLYFGLQFVIQRSRLAARRLLFASIVYLPLWFVLSATLCSWVRRCIARRRISDSLSLMMYTPTKAVSSSRPRATPVAGFAWATLCCNVAVVLWGAYVRATGSGAGCGNKWPLCNGSVLSTSAKTHTIIEFTHRVTSGMVLLMVAGLLIWCWWVTSRRDWARYAAILAAVFLANEALLGAALVLLDHVAQDKSAGRVFFLCLHFGNTLLLLATLSLTADWLSKGGGRFTVIRNPREIVAVGMGLLATMVIGITGAVAALGDTLFPATSLRSSLMQDFTSGAPTLLRFRLLHPVVAVVAAAYVSWVIWKTSTRRARFSPSAMALMITLVAQLSIGLLNVLLLAPVWLQILHLLVADVFWILLVLASADLVLVSARSTCTEAVLTTT